MVGVANEGQLQTSNAGEQFIYPHLVTNDQDKWPGQLAQDILQNQNKTLQQFSGLQSPYNIANNNTSNNPLDWYEFIKRLMFHVNLQIVNNAANLADNQWQQTEINNQQTLINPARTIWSQIYNNLQRPNNSHPMRVTN